MKIFRIAFAAAALCAMTAPASSDELYGTLKKVRDTKTFTIGFREASFPFAYYDDDKKPVGFSVELCNRIADTLKQQLNLPDLAVRYLPINAQTRIPLLLIRLYWLRPPSTNEFSRSANACGCSQCGKCPAPGMTSSLAPGISRRQPSP